jgi:hypothetical protein
MMGGFVVVLLIAGSSSANLESRHPDLDEKLSSILKP